MTKKSLDMCRGFFCDILEVFGPEVSAIEGGEAVIFVEFIEDEELTACCKLHIYFFMEVSHNDVIDLGVRCCELFCPINLESI